MLIKSKRKHLESQFKGQPNEIKFCKKCVISNQRPNSVIEFKNSNKQLNMVQMDHLSEDQRFWYAKAITKLILADGRIDLYERVYLHGAIQILEDPDHVRDIEESILLNREIKLGNVFGLSEKDQERILSELIEIATVDLDFDIEEQEVLREIGNAMGASRKSIQKTIDRGFEIIKQ